MAENGSKVIVKIVNPTETTQNLTITGDWKGIVNAGYTYYAPGSLTAANSMENKNAVSSSKKEIPAENNRISMTIEPLSAGVLIIEKDF